MELNLNNFLESQNQINTHLVQSNEQIAKMLTALKQEGIDTLSTEIDGIRNAYNKIKNDISIIKEDNKEKDKKIESLNDDISKLKERTLILATDNGKKKEWTKTIQSLAYTYNGGRNTLEYELFHRTIINDCYAHIYNIYQINTYTDIKIDDYDQAITSMRKWFGNNQNIKKSRNRKIHDLIQKMDKGTIKEHERNLCNKYLNKQGEDM